MKTRSIDQINEQLAAARADVDSFKPTEHATPDIVDYDILVAYQALVTIVDELEVDLRIAEITTENYRNLPFWKNVEGVE